ncbi:MAG: DNA topoisomerase IB [Bacteroidota bacterium]
MDIPSHLVFYADDQPGIVRKKRGRGYQFLCPEGKPITRNEELQRLKTLVIPPAWQHVWISPMKNGHLQSTGKDEKRRKQYIYHPDYMAYRQMSKFQKMAAFGAQLPAVREYYEKDLTLDSWTKRKMLALVTYLLDHYHFRVGNWQYMRDNETYGLTTLRRKHLNEIDNDLQLSYKAKSGKQRKVRINNPKAAKLIREISELPGYEIFRYKNNQGKYETLDSSEVNEYLKGTMDGSFTAKDFRTWGASLLAIEKYEAAKEELTKNQRLKFEPTLVKKVARQMGNTLSVCRQYYIHPEVLEFLTNAYPKTLDLPTARKRLKRSEEFLLKIISS